MNITQKLIEQAKQAQSAEEILSLAKENGVKLTAEDAQKYFEMWHTSAELSDEELDNVAGGCGEVRCPHCGSDQLIFLGTLLGVLEAYRCESCGYHFH